MKTSALVIAYNEERHIAGCIESLLVQSRPADEIVVLVHNSTDATESIARRYPVRVIPYSGPVGIVHARLEGLRHVTGDWVACIDGDSRASSDWLATLVGALEQGHVLVGSWIRFEGTLFDIPLNIFNRYCCRMAKDDQMSAMIYGASFAFRGSDLAHVRSILLQTLALSNALKLSRHPDDYWLALFMARRGRLAVTDRTHVIATTREGTALGAMRRNLANIKNGNAIRAYMAGMREAGDG